MKPVSSFKPITILLICAGFALAMPILFSLAKSGPVEDVKGASTPKPKADLKQNFPVVEYGFETSTESRPEKSKKYDKFKILDPNITEDVEEASFLDWVKSSSALPIKESQLILLGKVVDSRAQLSEKKNSVYSEFKIEIEKVFKNDSETQIEANNYFRAERDGGIVVYPSGLKTWYYVSGQGMPIVGEKYLFFLTNDFPQYGHQKKDLFLLTAYQLKNGLVEPLDNPGGGTHAISKYYRGRTEASLLSDLVTALKSSTTSMGRPQ